jgi:hypothetical protein
VDPTRLAIAMYIVIIQLVFGPVIETAAVTIKNLVNTSTCRTDANDKVNYEEVASHCNMCAEGGDHRLGVNIARNSIGEAINVSSSSSSTVVQSYSSSSGVINSC